MDTCAAVYLASVFFFGINFYQRREKNTRQIAIAQNKGKSLIISFNVSGIRIPFSKGKAQQKKKKKKEKNTFAIDIHARMNATEPDQPAQKFQELPRMKSILLAVGRGGGGTAAGRVETQLDGDIFRRAGQLPADGERVMSDSRHRMVGSGR